MVLDPLAETVLINSEVEGTPSERDATAGLDSEVLLHKVMALLDSVATSRRTRSERMAATSTMLHYVKQTSRQATHKQMQFLGVKCEMIA